MPINYIDYNQPSGGGGDFGWQLIKGRDISISSYSKILSFATYDGGNKTKITVESNGHRLAVSDVIKIEIYTYDSSTEYVGNHTVSSIIDADEFVIDTAWDSNVDTNSNSYRFAIPSASSLSDADTFLIDVGNTGNQSTTKPISALTMKSYFGGSIDVSGTPVANDYARFTDADTLEGRSYSELASDIGSSINTIGTVTTGTLSTGAVLADVTMTLGSDADGDIYYRSSNKLTRLAKGTAGQALIMNGGATAPEWGAAGSSSSIDESNPILDSFGDELLSFHTVGDSVSPINYIEIQNSATGYGPGVFAKGDDTNIGLSISSKGTGLIEFIENGKFVTLDINGATATKKTTLDFNHTDDRTITFPDYTGEVVLKENLSIDDDTTPLLGGNLQLGGNTIVQQSTDMITFTTNGNRHLSLDFDSQAADSALVLTSSVTTSRVIGFPDAAGTLALTDQILIKSTTELETELANIDSDVTIGNASGVKVITSGELQVGNTSHSTITPVERDGDDLAGYRMNIQGGPSTGSGAGGAINLRTSPGDGGTASTVNNFDTILSISGDGHIGIKAASKLFLDGENANGGTYIQESSDNVIKLVAGGADMLVLDEGNSMVTFGGVAKGTQIELAETSVPGNQTSGYGTLYIDDGKPYFKNDDDNINALSSPWSATFNGYKTSASTSYYFPYYGNENSYANADSTPTTINYADLRGALWIAPQDCVFEGFKGLMVYTNTSSHTNPVRFYVFKGSPYGLYAGTNLSLTQIAVTDTITFSATNTNYTNSSITISTPANEISAGDYIFVMFKKTASTGNTNYYFSGSIYGRYV